MTENRVAIDIQDVENEAILDALLGEKGEVFKTARGRKSILIGTAALLKLQAKLSLRFEDGQDGNQILKA